ncbi:efflux RND transporter periplasmic adaptor subunit [Haliovirga abyssi]|uniref:Efflux RND transporter periplasmic adaptor subunit n=1 Tax=Haliovirga abyssi TaxID=2996794 RepID=A0AAU9DSE0_9FUSO|nr:efflux RND transporter periplasmic adaptor subunit [Haliovirga abyssi]BDU49929.1 hypothetical protein HLVA_04980 [Haliovirga abyssi]
MKKSKLIIGAILIISIGVVSSGFGKKAPATTAVVKKETKKSVKVEIVKTQKIQKKVVTNGQTEPLLEVKQSSKIGGEISDILVKNGDYVKKDDVILKLDNDRIEANYKTAKANYLMAKSNYERVNLFSKSENIRKLEQAEAGVTSAKMKLEKALKGADKEEISNAESRVKIAESNYNLIKNLYEKNRQLYKENLISEQGFMDIENKYENAKNSYETAKRNLILIKKGADEEDITSLRANLQNAEQSYELLKKYVDNKIWEYEITNSRASYLTAKANYELMQKQYDDLTVNAKISGVITNMNLDKYGQVKAEGKIPMFSVINTSEMIVEVGISGKDFMDLEKKDKVRIYIEDLDKWYNGEVYEMNPSASEGTDKFKVKIKLKNPDNRIQVGMYVKAEIDTKTINGILVPKKAIVIDNLSKYIFISENGKAKKMRVETGIENGNNIEILSKNIKAGDEIIIEGQYTLENNSLINEVK